MIEQLDKQMLAHGGLSLSPDRTHATPLVVLVEQFELPRGPLMAIASAHLEHFPDTIFWDYDHLANFLTSKSRPASEIADQMIALFEQFGRHSEIGFRYVHDFFFGFDWVKWVQKDFENRRHTHPFDEAAMNYLKRRGEEIVELISKNDEKYPPLPTGQPRNAYSFSREPDDEKRLFETAASRELIPLQMWNYAASPRCNIRFLEEREAVANELGLGSPQ